MTDAETYFLLIIFCLKGPVVCISSFASEEEVIRRANGVSYGLSATLWTQDVSRLHRVAQQIEVILFLYI